MTVRGPEIEREKMGRVFDDQTAYRALLSGRVGWHLGRPARTFTCLMGSIKGGGRFDATIDYIEREGDYSGRDDLEHVAGDAERLREAARAIDAGARLRRGRTAERVLIKIVHELPAGTTALHRRDTAEREVAYWRGRGHEAIAAVHAAGKVQPHIHVLVSARPVTEADGWKVDRKARVMVGKAAVRAERAAVANFVNEVLDDHQMDTPRFFAGRDAQMDRPGLVDRQPKRRVPQRVWRVSGQHERGPQEVADRRDQHDADRQEAENRAHERAIARQERTQGKLERLGAVPVETMKQAEEGWARTAKELKIATAAQARLILAMAREAGVTITAEQVATLDGGDLMAAVKAAKTKDRQAWQSKIEVAEARAAKEKQAPPNFPLEMARQKLEKLRPHLPAPAWEAITADPRSIAVAVAAMQATAIMAKAQVRPNTEQKPNPFHQPHNRPEAPRRRGRSGQGHGDD